MKLSWKKSEDGSHVSSCGFYSVKKSGDEWHGYRSNERISPEGFDINGAKSDCREHADIVSAQFERAKQEAIEIFDDAMAQIVSDANTVLVIEAKSSIDDKEPVKTPFFAYAPSSIDDLATPIVSVESDTMPVIANESTESATTTETQGNTMADNTVLENTVTIADAITPVAPGLAVPSVTPEPSAYYSEMDYGTGDYLAYIHDVKALAPFLPGKERHEKSGQETLAETNVALAKEDIAPLQAICDAIRQELRIATVPVRQAQLTAKLAELSRRMAAHDRKQSLSSHKQAAQGIRAVDKGRVALAKAQESAKKGECLTKSQCQDYYLRLRSMRFTFAPRSMGRPSLVAFFTDYGFTDSEGRTLETWDMFVKRLPAQIEHMKAVQTALEEVRKTVQPTADETAQAVVAQQHATIGADSAV